MNGNRVPPGKRNWLWPRLAAPLILLLRLGAAAEPPAEKLPGPSPILQSVTWHWETLQTAAPGSDLWPITWGADDHLYTAWGDGGGFGGTDSQGRVSLGFARVEGGPIGFRGVNINGGQDAEHPSSFPGKGKVSGLLSLGGRLYANLNLQDGTWPDVHHQLAWSTNQGATWQRAEWRFDKGPGAFQPAKFLNFGRDYTGVPDHLAGYVYLAGFRQPATRAEVKGCLLARVPVARLLDRAAYEFFRGCDSAGRPQWDPAGELAQPILSDPRGLTSCSVVYSPALRRYLATGFHTGPGQLGIYDAPEPWGPWTIVAEYEDWGGMGTAGEGLSCEFPAKWMSADGREAWSIFSVYGDGGHLGIGAHDRFNLVRVTFNRKPAAGKHN